ncbi:synaptic vesicle glycoprotein 2B-like [Ostrinia nubilalis]|uniref:synaptic vesicle glycoprotein 2B-like n=1 Tax=Ostrinia nubilalis TaxID=29057 RepID=UPI003082469C
MSQVKTNTKKSEVYLMDNLKRYYSTDAKGTTAEYFETDLEEALDIVGAGKYQVYHSILMLATLSAALLEIIGNAFILPAAACDLNLPDHLKGIVTSVPNLGVILTAPLWGWAADSLGRKPVLLVSCIIAGALGLVAAFASTLTGYAGCKFAASLFLSCPSSLGWAYISEMLPRRRRDAAVLACNGFLMLSSTLSPVIAWGILSFDWRFIRPWRLLTIIYAMPLLLVALGVACADESPKFLVAKGKKRQALAVLKKIYAVNSGLTEDLYCVTSLRDDGKRMTTEPGPGCVVTKWRGDSTLTLLRPPYLKWLALTGFLMFGLFSLLNGLFLLAPDTINKIFSDPIVDEGNICVFIDQSSNDTLNKPSEACVDTISHATFLIMVVTTLVYSIVVLLACLSPINKKTLLIAMFTTVGAACLMSGLQENRLVAGVAMSAMQLTALGIGPLTAYTCHLFPTTLRGTAVGAVLMFGRVGSVAGASAAGYFLAAACAGTFYGFSALLFLCAALSFLLPTQHDSHRSCDYEDTDAR